MKWLNLKGCGYEDNHNPNQKKKYSEIFERFKKSVDYFEPYSRKIVVTSGEAKINAPGWEVIKGIRNTT